MPEEKSPTQRIIVEKRGSAAYLLLRGFLRGLGRPQGKRLDGLAGDPPLLLAETPRFTYDPRRIRQFREVCGYTEGDAEVPVVYSEILFVAPLAEMIVHPSFPLSPLGLIHIRQRITQHRAIRPGEEASLSCRISEMRETERGIELDARMEILAKGECVWEGLATFLSRNEDTRSGKSRTRRSGDRPAPPEPMASTHLEGDTGRRYAAVSGDYNPHHLWPWSAKLLGYKRPIAHGIWTLAHALAVLERETEIAYPCEIDAHFKRPIFMPGDIALSWEKREGGFSYEVRDPNSGAPHLVGNVSFTE